jgi:hypothetical protein
MNFLIRFVCLYFVVRRLTYTASSLDFIQLYCTLDEEFAPESNGTALV